MRRSRLATGVAWAAVACVVTGCGAESAATSPTPRVGARVGDVAPAVVGTSIEGHPLTFSGSRGSVLVLIFWASWCTPCQAEQPAINALAREEMKAGVRFAGVSVDVSGSAAQAFSARFAVPYDSLLDGSDALAVAFEVTGPPTTFVIDRSGRVAAELVGEVNSNDLRARIAAAQAAL